MMDKTYISHMELLFFSILVYLNFEKLGFWIWLKCWRASLGSYRVFWLQVCSTLRSWLHKIATRINFCPLDWRTTKHWNVVLVIFQHNHICQDCWKNTKSTYDCMFILKSRGQGPESCWKYGTDLYRSFPSFVDLVPWILE